MITATEDGQSPIGISGELSAVPTIFVAGHGLPGFQ